MGGRTDENHPGVIGPANVQGVHRMGRGKIGAELGQNRRALSAINRNIEALPPCAVNKRGLTEKLAIAGTKHAAIPSHRPVTRKFAAQLANTHQQPCVEVLQPIETYSSDSEDCTIIDVGKYNMSDDSSVPMYVKHTEAMMDEIDLMDDEVEMEDVMPESIMDIDCDDSKNPLAVVEYVDDIYSHYKKTEASGLEGPIPFGISLLTKIYDLRISDINGTENAFPPLSNMKSMKTLILRSCNIVGEIPAYLGEMINLSILILEVSGGYTSVLVIFMLLNELSCVILSGGISNAI